jgi:hypothetical protein
MSSNELDGLTFPRVRPRIVCIENFSRVSKLNVTKMYNFE